MALSNFSATSPNGLVASIPILSDTPLKSWEGSKDEPKAPGIITTSSLAWALLAIAHSISCKSNMSTSSSTITTYFISLLEPRADIIAALPSPGFFFLMEAKAPYR